MVEIKELYLKGINSGKVPEILEGLSIQALQHYEDFLAHQEFSAVDFVETFTSLLPTNPYLLITPNALYLVFKESKYQIKLTVITKIIMEQMLLCVANISLKYSFSSKKENIYNVTYKWDSPEIYDSNYTLLKEPKLEQIVNDVSFTLVPSVGPFLYERLSHLYEMEVISIENWFNAIVTCCSAKRIAGAVYALTAKMQ